MLQFVLIFGVLEVALSAAGHTQSCQDTGLVESRLRRPGWPCAVPALTAAGWVCSARRTSYAGAPYASFRGVPYAKQPVGELRFKTLRPLNPWNGYYNATVEGPVCPQKDEIYKDLMKPRSIGEECILANIHVPWGSLPGNAGCGTECQGDCLPVLVYAPAGGFTSGSGDSDMHGPEYMIDRGVVIITFNYRVGPFGFLSLNSTDIPGNAGLRDMVTLLQWVQTNARTFGGNPDDVTFMGQSASGVAVQLLSMTSATRGLFKRVIALSGNALSGFYSSSPEYSQYVKGIFLSRLGITAADPDEIHRQLLAKTTQELIDANSYLQDTIGLVPFTPVKETAFPGVTRMVEDYPDALLTKGRGRNYPLLIGFTNVECMTLKRRLEELNIMEAIESNPIAALPPKMAHQLSNTSALLAAKKLGERYFNGKPTLDKFLAACTDTFFTYPSLKVAEYRAGYCNSAPAYLQEFSYDSPDSVIKKTFNLSYKGAAHLEDLFYVFRVNSVLGGSRLSARDERVMEWMTGIVANFMRCSSPTCGPASCGSWSPVSSPLRYQHTAAPRYNMSALTPQQTDMMTLFDQLYALP